MRRRGIETSPGDTPQYGLDLGESEAKLNRKNKFKCTFIFVVATVFLINYVEKTNSIDTLISEVNVRQSENIVNKTAVFMMSNITSSPKTHIDKADTSQLHQLVDMECNKDDQRTVRCPLGKLTPPDYHKNMITLYSSNDPDFIELYNKCLDLSLPLTRTDPVECWPNIFILPSHATNGNSLARDLLTKVTGMQLTFNHYNEGVDPKQLYDLSTSDNNKESIHISSELNDATLPLPIMDRAAIFKSHITQSMNKREWNKNTKLMKGSAEQMGHVEGGGFSGIIRLARNPGDQILRNTFRWRNLSCYKKGDDCFFKKAHKSCGQLRSAASEFYVGFHSFWDQYDNTIPQTLFHYERFSSLTDVKGAIHDVSKFLNFTTKEVNYMDFDRADMSEELKAIVKEPGYEHGTLLAKVCGKTVARNIHEITKDVAEKLGYSFDNESATWSLDLT